MSPAHRTRLLLSWGLAAAAAAAWCALAVVQWRGLVVPSWDLGIFTQLADAYAQPRAPVVDIKGVGTHLLGDHWHPILLALGPVYRLWPSGLTLLVVQGVLFALSVVPLARVAMDRLGTALGAGVGAAYALSWGLASAAWAQFHEIAFAVPLLALSLAAHLRGRWRACALWAAPLVLVKEDLGLTVAALGVVLLLAGRRADPADRADARRWGVALVAWGLVWFVVTITLLLPAFNAQGRWDYTARIAGSDAEVAGPLAHLLAEPGTKLLTLVGLALAAGGIGVVSPLVLLALPTLAWRFLGEVPAYWGTTWHYSAVLMPIATAALVDVAARWRARDTHRVPWPALALAAALATTVITAATGPLTRLAEPDAFAWSWRAAPLAQAARTLDADGREGARPTVSTDLGPLAYLVPHARVRWVGNAATDPPPQWVLLDVHAGAHAATRPDAATWAARTWPGTTWEPVTREGGYDLARRTDVTNRP